MNYRHSFHAGNFADVFKHIILSRIIEHLKIKDKAFRVVDTHAGAGAYELAASDQVSASGKPPEWIDGVGRLVGWQPEPELATVLAPYLSAVLGENGVVRMTYPGSPLLALNLMRKQDRLTACELHPETHEELKGRFAGNHQVRVLNLDGWLIPGSQLPPKEKRGLLLIDPPFEKPDDFERMANAAITVARRWSGGTIALWYPLKHARQVTTFHQSLASSGIRDLVVYELEIARPSEPPTLYGCGMIVRNGPYTLMDEMKRILPGLLGRLERSPRQGRWRVSRLTEE